MPSSHLHKFNNAVFADVLSHYNAHKELYRVNQRCCGFIFLLAHSREIQFVIVFFSYLFHINSHIYIMIVRNTDGKGGRQNAEWTPFFGTPSKQLRDARNARQQRGIKVSCRLIYLFVYMPLFWLGKKVMLKDKYNRSFTSF